MKAGAGAVTIGEAARLSGVSAKMIRHYEAIGLVRPAEREASGYRTYGAASIHTLCFVGRARSLGFPIATIADLLALWRDHGRSNADVRGLAQRHAEQLRQKMAALATMAAALDKLVGDCAGDGRPECPILDELAEFGKAAGSEPAGSAAHQRRHASHPTPAEAAIARPALPNTTRPPAGSRR